MARLACAVGVTDEDIVQILPSATAFSPAPFGLHGRHVEDRGPDYPPFKRQHREAAHADEGFRAWTALVATPSYAIYMAEMMKELGYKRRISSSGSGWFGSEGCTREMRESIEKIMGIIVTDNYGASELNRPRRFGRVPLPRRPPLRGGPFLPEIIDSDTLEVKERWGDGGARHHLADQGGFSHPPVQDQGSDQDQLRALQVRAHSRQNGQGEGASDDMLIIKGVNVFPSQIESVIVGMEGIGPITCSL